MKITDTFLGIAKVVYDLEEIMADCVEQLSNCKSSAAPEAIERIEKAQKVLMATPKKKQIKSAKENSVKVDVAQPEQSFPEAEPESGEGGKKPWEEVKLEESSTGEA